MSIKSIVASPLPENDVSDLGLNVTPEEYVRKVLAVDLPAKERSALRDELIWNFVLEKNAEKKRAKKKPRKNTFLTRKERVTKALLKLPKDGWDYESLQPIRDMWKQYMRENIDFNPDVPKFTDTEWMNLNVVTGKCEYVGAEVEVIRSRSPCIVGVKGTLVLETKMTFQVVTPASKLKIVPKEDSVFMFYLDNIKFTVFGKYIMVRPSERSVKKVKSNIVPDL